MKKVLTNKLKYAIIYKSFGDDEKLQRLRNCVRGALVTLTHSVRVRILIPQPERTWYQVRFFTIQIKGGEDHANDDGRRRYNKDGY